MKISEALPLCKPPPHTLSTLITCITQPLMSLGLNRLHNPTSPNITHIITMATLKEKFSKVTAKSKIALNRMAALVNLPQSEDLTPGEIHKLLAYESTDASTLAIYRKINKTHTSRLVDTTSTQHSHPQPLIETEQKHTTHRSSAPTSSSLSNALQV